MQDQAISLSRLVPEESLGRAAGDDGEEVFHLGRRRGRQRCEGQATVGRGNEEAVRDDDMEGGESSLNVQKTPGYDGGRRSREKGGLFGP
jgi:hypothetical protein